MKIYQAECRAEEALLSLQTMRQMEVKMAEFERQLQSKRMIRVYDRIGQPAQFKPASGLNDTEIRRAWISLSALMLRNGINLEVNSPNISPRELYRFATEELFFQEIQDIRIPGMVHGFLYDDFYPDHAYNNINLVLNYCLHQLFRKDPMEWMGQFRKTGLYLNGYEGLEIEELITLANGFKERVSRFEQVEVDDVVSIVEGKRGSVKGSFRLRFRMDHAAYYLAGKWSVQLERDRDNNWYILSVEIPGIDF